jgi:adenosine/AMP kinase
VKNLDIITIKLEVPEDSNLILGQSHFIKTVEDLYEALAEASLGIKFGIAFSEASGPCLIRSSGNDQELESLAANMLLKIGAGHSFIIYLKNAFPVNVLKRVQSVSEVVRIFCATANPTQVLVAESDQGRGIIGVIDGFSPKGIETENDKEERKKFLRTIGYKPPI